MGISQSNCNNQTTAKITHLGMCHQAALATFSTKAPLRAWEKGNGVTRRVWSSSGFIARLIIITLVAALAGVIALSLVFLTGVRPGEAAPSSLSLPFRPGQTWIICQGYNTSEIDHIGTMVNALDLSISPTSASGTYGCTGANNASQGEKVTAPSSGPVVSYPTTDMACIKFDSLRRGREALLGHRS